MKVGEGVAGPKQVWSLLILCVAIIIFFTSFFLLFFYDSTAQTLV